MSNITDEDITNFINNIENEDNSCDIGSNILNDAIDKNFESIQKSKIQEEFNKIAVKTDNNDRIGGKTKKSIKNKKKLNKKKKTRKIKMKK